MSKKNTRKEAATEMMKAQTNSHSAQQKKTEKKPFTISKGATIGMALAVTVAVAALGIYELVARNSDMLWMAQSKSYFTTNRIFLEECMHQPGGLIAWIASFLTQFFYHPALGASIMVVIWAASMWLSKLAFQVRSAWMAVLAIPAVCLLVSTIDTGYWLYYIKQVGYWFYGTVGYFITMALVWFHSLFKKRFDRLITTVLIALTYPFAGWYTLLALVYIAMLAIARHPRHISFALRILRPAVPLILALAIPMLCYRLYTEIHSENIWTTGFPRFENDTTVNHTLAIPFIIMSAVPVIFPFLPRRKKIAGGMAWAVTLLTVIILAASYIWVDKENFQTYNYHAEMRMYRAADEQDWEKVLDEMGNIPGDASRQMVLLKNVALLNKGEMGSKMFKYNNMGEPPTNGFDTLHVHMVQTAAPLLYYYHGKTNFASRWCIENSVEFGYNFDNLKILARCALVNGEMDVARKYLDILRTSTFYKEWADNYLPIIEKPELIKKYPEFSTVCELRDNMGTVLDGDNGLCEMYLLQYFSNTMNKEDKLLQELTLNYALVQKDIQLFWPRFFLYAQMHKDETMPVHYQEAAMLYGHLEPQNVDISNMPFDKSVRERYEGFQQLSQSLLTTGMTSEEVGEAVKSTYGDTFYWFYFFCRNVHSY